MLTERPQTKASLVSIPQGQGNPYDVPSLSILACVAPVPVGPYDAKQPRGASFSRLFPWLCFAELSVAEQIYIMRTKLYAHITHIFGKKRTKII